MNNMKKQSKKSSNTRKKSFNIYAWNQKHKKTFASCICIVIVLAMILAIFQI